MAMLDSPLTGVGVDNFVSAFRTFKSEEFVLQYGSGLTTNNAHSTPAQIGATFGLAVFLLYCLLHLWILCRALKVISSRDTSQFYLKGVALMWILIFSQSLLSIEIIGLGVMNWVLGAIILSATSIRANPDNLEEIRTGKKQRTQSLPAWTGSLTIASLLTGSILVIPVSREDKAFQNLAFIQVADEQSKSIVRQEYEKLSNLTLLYPNKIDAIAANIFKADMSSELGKAAENLYRVDKSDAYAANLLATYYQNTGQANKELEVRERIRALDPWNSNLELSLARAYAASGQAIKLQESVDRLKSIAPSSEDYQQALSLLKEPLVNP
jgi:tetratricopeptide (TPR) repeat protein